MYPFPLQSKIWTETSIAAFATPRFTDELSIDNESVIDVMRKAHEIDLRPVHDLCMSHCRKQLRSHNCIWWLVQADEHRLEELRHAALRFAVANLRMVKATAQETFELLRPRPDLLLGLLLEAA